ncbi:MAG: hypothetical protein ACYSW0_14665, partial [Planctomycetota bacterium]
SQVGGEGAGVWSVTLSDFDPVVAPEGQNVLYTENAPTGVANGVAQVLTEMFAANTDYTLTAEVGNSWYYYFAGYSVQLLAGGTVIAEDNDTLVVAGLHEVGHFDRSVHLRFGRFGPCGTAPGDSSTQSGAR